MIHRRDDRRKGITEGVVISIFEDQGPVNLYNSSSLTDDEAFNMALRSLTVIGSDIPLEYGEIRSYGPIPTPRPGFFSLGFIFSLKAVDSIDSRIQRFGRLIVFWVITRTDTSIQYIGVIKRIIQRVIRTNRIITDEDIRNESIWYKIDEQLSNIDTGIERYYIDNDGFMQSFLDLTMVPLNAPIILVDHSAKQITVLLREKVTPGAKNKALNVINDYKRDLHKGSLFKTEIISDSILIQTILSKQGLATESLASQTVRYHLSQEVNFGELNDFFENFQAPKRQKLISQIIEGVNAKEQINLNQIAFSTGYPYNFIVDFVKNAINAGIIRDYKLDEGIMHPTL